MNRAPSIRRCRLYLFALLAGLGCRRAQAQDPVPVTAASQGKPKYTALEDEQAMYSPFESPWADLKANHTLETHLLNLLRAEVRLWTLQDQLAGKASSPAHENANEISRIIHGQVLDEAGEALLLLQRTPNKAFAQLLVHELESYPFEWKEEGSEQLLPGLHKLVDPPADKPANERRARRRRSP